MTNASEFPPELEELYARPGFLMRRAHQIAVGVFLRDCAEFGLTAPQHSTLFVISRRPGLNQAEVARALGFDRATIGKIIEGLDERGLVLRSTSPSNKRDKVLVLTSEGLDLLAAVSAQTKRMSEHLLSPLEEAERKQFVSLLIKLTSALNSQSRTPLIAPPAMGRTSAAVSRSGVVAAVSEAVQHKVSASNHSASLTQTASRAIKEEGLNVSEDKSRVRKRGRRKGGMRVAT